MAPFGRPNRRNGSPLGGSTLTTSAPRSASIIAQPFHDLLHLAQATHRAHFDPHAIEGAMLLSIKTGGCPEDCAYCPQSAKYSTGLDPQRLMATDEIVSAARAAKAAGATRFC